jgi:ABC-type branched-subunit amino acid transport system substrate-binding protein
MWSTGSTSCSRRALLPVLVAGALAVAIAGCGSNSGGGSSGGSGGGSKMTIADVAPFTGTDGALGPTYLVSCDAATQAINSSGGVLGHQLNCK